MADKAFDAQSLIDGIGARGNSAENQSEGAQKLWQACQQESRYLIERFFACLKQFRRIATHYEKLDIRFQAFISIAVALIWLA